MMGYVTWFFGAVLIASLFTGCASIRSMTAAGPRDYILVENIFQVPDSDGFEVSNLRIENDSLRFVASYDGGCREHVFTLYASRGEVEDTGHLYVQHNANHDLCGDRIPADPVTFSLTGLRGDLDLGAAATLRLAASDSVYVLEY